MNKLFPLLLLLAIQQTQAQEDAPPAYPRDGATRMLENDHVIVWNISWLKQDYPVHRHRYDHTGVYYSPGDRLITSPDGEVREVHTEPWNISFQLAGVTHTESGLSDEPLQAVFIQIKRPIAGAAIAATPITRFPGGALMEQRRSNERIRVWEYPEGFSADAHPEHFHEHDAVVVWFDPDNRPNVYFISRGTIDAGDYPSQAERVLVFEIL